MDNKPAAVLPNITSQVTIDGSTQTSNQSNTNTFGPEVEVDGKNINGPSFNLAGSSSSSILENIVINNNTYTGVNLVLLAANSITINNNYIGIDVKGLISKSASNQSGIAAGSTVNGIIIIR